MCLILIPHIDIHLEGCLETSGVLVAGIGIRIVQRSTSQER